MRARGFQQFRTRVALGGAAKSVLDENDCGAPREVLSRDLGLNLNHYIQAKRCAMFSALFVSMGVVPFGDSSMLPSALWPRQRVGHRADRVRVWIATSGSPGLLWVRRSRWCLVGLPL